MSSLTSVANSPEEKKYTLREFKRVVYNVIAIEEGELKNISMKKKWL